jgi:uncharacterized protein YaaQ
MRLSKALEEKKLDVRLRDRLVTEGKFTKEDEQTYLAGLEDDASNLTFTEKESEEEVVAE